MLLELLSELMFEPMLLPEPPELMLLSELILGLMLLSLEEVALIINLAPRIIRKIGNSGLLWHGSVGDWGAIRRRHSRLIDRAVRTRKGVRNTREKA